MACGEDYYSFKCEKCGNLYRSYITCKHRTCQRCARVRSFQLVEMYLPVVLTFQWACLVTLTLKVGQNVKNDVDRILKCFLRLRHRKIWNAKQGIFSIEILKKDGDNWFVHLHALIDSKWMGQKELSKAWLEVTGDSSIVDIRRVTGDRKKSLKEILKYQTKMWELDGDEKEFIEKIFKHRRFVNSFGIKKPEKPKFEGMKCKIRLPSGKKCGGNLEYLKTEKGHGRREDSS